MEKKYYWFCDGSGLLTEGEKKTWIYRYHRTEDEFSLSDVEILPTQTEYESICEWFQSMDPNGSYLEIAQDLRDPENADYFLFNVDALIAIVAHWMDEDWETSCEFASGLVKMMTRLLKLREEVTR